MDLIIDSHCHAWRIWPYQPSVPDPVQRGRIEQLLHEMNLAGVQQALLVSAQIEHNPKNNAYIAEQVQLHPDRLHQLVDLDSKWSQTYHLPGADERLRKMAELWPIKGFTHYLDEEEDGSWLHGPEGLALFQAASELSLIASISCLPHQQAAVRSAAERFPQVPVLCHHLGFVKAGKNSPEQNLQQVLDSSRVPNVYIKVSGFAYASEKNWDFPYKDVHWIVKAVYETYGPFRMCWGSDYPVVRFFMTYQQALEAFRTHCAFIPDLDMDLILGKTLMGLLESAGGKKELMG